MAGMIRKELSAINSGKNGRDGHSAFIPENEHSAQVPFVRVGEPTLWDMTARQLYVTPVFFL